MVLCSHTSFSYGIAIHSYAISFRLMAEASLDSEFSPYDILPLTGKSSVMFSVPRQPDILKLVLARHLGDLAMSELWPSTGM